MANTTILLNKSALETVWPFYISHDLSPDTIGQGNLFPVQFTDKGITFKFISDTQSSSSFQNKAFKCVVRNMVMLINC